MKDRLNRIRCSLAFQALAMVVWTFVFNAGNAFHHIVTIGAVLALVGALGLSYVVQ